MNPHALKHALKSGHWPSLLGAWLHFEVSFVVWLLIGALGIAIAQDFALSATQKGLLVAIPLLGRGPVTHRGRAVHRSVRRETGRPRHSLDRSGGAVVGMAVRSQLCPNVRDRSVAGGGGCEFCRGASRGEPRLSFSASGAGHGHRRDRKQRGFSWQRSSPRVLPPISDGTGCSA